MRTPTRSRPPRGIYRSPEGEQRIRAWCERAIASWDQPNDHRTVATGLGPTAVLTTGAGPDLVLLAGTNFATATWLGFVSALAAHSTVHAIDLPGQPGLSAARRPAAGARGYGAWLAEVLGFIGVRRPVVLGHSLGAAVALSAGAAGVASSRLVLLDPAGLARLRVSPGVLRATLPWLRRPGPRTSDGLLRRMLAPGAAPDEALVTWMSLVGQHVRTSLAPAPLPPRLLRGLAAIPVDVLSGRHDAFLPAQRLAGATSRRLPHASLSIVEGAGHLLPFERPEAVVDHLERGRAG